MGVTVSAGLGAASAVAAGLGLAVDQAAVLAEGSELVIGLHPLGLVARVCVADDDRRRRAPASRQVELARYGARQGAPVAAPARGVDPGPHRRGDLLVTLWEQVPAPFPVSATDAGRSLRLLHERLANYPGELTSYDPRPFALEVAAALTEMGVPRPAAEAARVLRLAAAAYEPPDLPTQALHGDAHLGNVVSGPTGPLWIDLEDACRGPVEWDLACVAHRATISGVAVEQTNATLAGYGPDAAERAETMAEAVALHIAARTAYAVTTRPELRGQLDERVTWLRERLGL